MSNLDRFITSWFVTDAVLLSYWEIAEAAQPGRQYASPYLPCAWMATMFAPIVFLTWRLIRIWRSAR